MKRLALAAAAGLLASTAPLYAADIPFESPIRSVVVYPQGAAVTREGMFNIPAGTSVLVIAGIPTSIDASSIRVGGLGDAGIQILSVEARTEKAPDAEDPERTRINDAIQGLRDQQALLNDQLTALQGQRTFIQNLIAEGPAGFAELLGTQGAGINQWATAWQTIGQGMAEVLDNIRQVGLQQREIEEEVGDLMAQLAALPQLRQGLEIRIEVSATAEATGALATTYQVGSARWAPAYDAFLTTGDDGGEPAIELVRRAEIQQQTGENWTDVALTLSTSRPAGGTAAPYLSEAILQVYERGRYDGYGALAAPAAAEVRGGAFDAVAPPAPPIPEQQATADFGDFRADFIIQTPVTVDSGVGLRSVRLSTDSAPARLFATATPRVAEQAFLTAAFTLESEAPILAGRANLFRDGSFIGTGNLAFSNPGQEVELGFGADDQVRVTFALLSRETGERGLLTRLNTDERHYRITVENGHSRPMEITVLDRIPVTEDERILVEQLPDTTEPTETDVDGRRGVLAWTYTYEPGEDREIDNAYVVTWPADLDLYGIE